MRQDLTPQDQASLDILTGTPSHALTKKMSEALELYTPWCIAYRDEVYRLGYGFVFERLEDGDVRVAGFRKMEEA